MFGKKCGAPSLFSILLWIGAAMFTVTGVLCMVGAVKRMAPDLCRKAKMVEKDCADACQKIAADVCGDAGCGCTPGDGDACNADDENGENGENAQ